MTQGYRSYQDYCQARGGFLSRLHTSPSEQWHRSGLSVHDLEFLPNVQASAREELSHHNCCEQSGDRQAPLVDGAAQTRYPFIT